jgi:adhesin HecA-like repeat protein
LSGLTRATDDIAISAATLSLAPEAQIDSGNNLIIGASGAINIGTLAVLQAESGINISTPLSITNRGIIKATDNVTLQSASTIDNQGAYITADAVQINAAQALDNSQFGTIQAGNIGLWINTHTLLNPSGYIISGNIIDLQLGIGGLNNTGGVIWAQENGDLLITTPGTITNHYGYLFADRDIDLWAVEKIDNLVGTIQAGRHAWLTTARLENRRTPVVRITGGNGRDFDDVETSDLAILSADGNLTITLESAPGLKDGSLLNDASILGAGGNLTITGVSLVNNAHTLMHERWERKKPKFPFNIWSKPKWILKEQWSTGTASTGQAGGIISINLTDSFHNTGNWIGSQFHLTAPTIINGITNYYTPTPAATVPRRQASFGMDSLPTPTNALFQTSRDPASLYLVTSTVPYNTDLELTPAALAARLGTDADPGTLRFFADPLYEAYLLERQAMADLGQRFYFDDVSTMREQRARLYENALALHQSFPDLALGEILTEAHLASLTEPVIWYEYQDLQAYRAALADYERRLAEWERAQSQWHFAASSKHGITRDPALASSPSPEPPTHIIPEQRILVPTIYLPQPLEQYAQIYGGKIQAHEATLHARDRIHNTGYINIRDDLTLAAGEIRNERRVAQGVATVQIKDVFETRTRNVFYDQIQEGGEISAGGNLTLLAGDAGITNIGGLIIGGEKVHLETTGSIHNDARRGEFIVNWNRGMLGAIFSMKSWDKGVLFIGGQIVAGDDLLILAGDTITNRGSTIEAVGDVTLSAPRLIEQDIHTATYTSYQGASIQGLGFNFATQKEIVTARSSILSQFGDVTLHSAEGDIRNIGSSLLAAYDLTLFAGQNIILDARTTEAIESAGGFSIAGTEISYHEAEWNKTKTEASLLSAGRNITLEAGHDIRSIGSFILSENDILLLAANDILFDQHTVRKWHISSGWTMAIDFFGSNIINTAIKGGDVGQAALSLLPGSDIIQGGESLFDAQDGWDYAAAATRLAVQGWNTAASVAKIINQRAAAKSSGQNPVSTTNQSSSLLQSTPIVNDPSGGIMSMLGIGQVSFRVDVWDKEDHWTESYRNTLHAGGDLTIQAGRDVTLAGGSRFTADGDIDIIAARSLRLLAGEDSFRSSYETSGGSVGVDLFSGGISLSGRHSQSRSNGTTYTPTFIGTPGTLRIQTGSDAHIQGSLAMADQILADIGGNLTIESLQDKFNSKSWGMSANVGFGAGISVGGSFNYAKASRAWVGEQAGFIAENSLDVDVDGHTHLRGALIQGAEGQSRFTTTTLSYEDIHDYDKSESFGISMNYSGIGKPAGQGQSSLPGMIGFNYLKTDKRGVVRSTVSGVEVETIEVQDLSGLNRAMDRAREITRDKKTKVKLVVPIPNTDGLKEDLDAMKAAWKEITKSKELPKEIQDPIEKKERLREELEKKGLSKKAADELVSNPAVQEAMQLTEANAELVMEEDAGDGYSTVEVSFVGEKDKEEVGSVVVVTGNESGTKNVTLKKAIRLLNEVAGVIAEIQEKYYYGSIVAKGVMQAVLGGPFKAILSGASNVLLTKALEPYIALGGEALIGKGGELIREYVWKDLSVEEANSLAGSLLVIGDLGWGLPRNISKPVRQVMVQNRIAGNQITASTTKPAATTASVPRRAGDAARTGARAGDDMVDVYRVFGGDARAQGFSWTTVDPRTVKNFRDAAGLPSGGASGATNTADFLIKGQAKASDIIKSRSALPLDGNRGGLPELIIDPKNVRLNDFSVLNP